MTFDILKSLFPKDRNSSLSDDDRALLILTEFQFEEMDGKTVIKKNGEILRDKTNASPLSVDSAINEYFIERKWIDHDPANLTLNSYSKFAKKWQEENAGVGEVSPEFQAAIAKHAASVKDFDYYS